MLREIYSERLYEVGQEPWQHLIDKIPAKLTAKASLSSLAETLHLDTSLTISTNLK
jgi:hypothetical protein